MVYNIFATYGLRKAYLCKPRHMYSRKTINIYMHILDTTYWYLDLVSITYFVYIVHTVHVYIYICTYICIYIYMYIYMHIYTYIYTETLDIQRVLPSIFNIPHILCKIYSTNIFTYIVYITSTVDTVHVAYTIYILSKSTYSIYICSIYIYVKYIYLYYMYILHIFY